MFFRSASACGASCKWSNKSPRTGIFPIPQPTNGKGNSTNTQWSLSRMRIPPPSMGSMRCACVRSQPNSDFSLRSGPNPPLRSAPGPCSSKARGGVAIAICACCLIASSASALQSIGAGGLSAGDCSAGDCCAGLGMVTIWVSRGSTGFLCGGVDTAEAGARDRIGSGSARKTRDSSRCISTRVTPRHATSNNAAWIATTSNRTVGRSTRDPALPDGSCMVIRPARSTTRLH
jgi:hypothetical protein